jgi:hypothetical protein
MSDRVGVFEGIDWAAGTDRGYHVVTIGPNATPEDVQAFRDAYELGVAWAEAEAALPEGWLTDDGKWALPSGSWIIGIEYRPESGDGYFEPHYEAAYFARAQIRGAGDKWLTGEDADSPAAALRALAEKLLLLTRP